MPSVGVSSERLHEVALWPVTEPAAAAQLARFAFTNAASDSAPSSLNAQIHCESVRPSSLYCILEFRGERRAQKVPSTEPLRSSKIKAFSSINSVSVFRWFILSANVAALFLSATLEPIRGRAFRSYRQLKACFPQKSTRKN